MSVKERTGGRASWRPAWLLTVGVLLALSLPPLDDVFAQDTGDLLGVLDRSLGVGAGGLEGGLLPELVADLDLGRGEDGGIACRMLGRLPTGAASEGSHL